MRPSFRKAGNPASHILAFPALRRAAIPMVLLATTALAGCATTNPPPEISYDNAAPAVQTVDPPAPVTVVELPRPLPLPGQLQRVEPSRRAPEPADPTARVNQANAAARIQPVRDGFINSMQVYPFTQGALYQVYTAVGQTHRHRVCSPASSLSAPDRSPPAIRFAGSLATPRADRGRHGRSISWLSQRGPT